MGGGNSTKKVKLAHLI